MMRNRKDQWSPLLAAAGSPFCEGDLCLRGDTVLAEVSAAQAESRGEAILTDYLHTLVDPYGTVSSTLCTSRREGDGLLVTLTAECVEEIGRAVPIYTDPTEESGG